MGNGSFTVKDLRLYDETSSSTRQKDVRQPLTLPKTSHPLQLPPSTSLPTQMILRWLLLAANVRKSLRDPLGGTHEVVDDGSLFDNNSNYSVTDSV